MSDLDITGRVVFDASQAEGALDKIGDKADQMAREVQGAAASAGKSVDKIGDGAAGSAEKFTRAEGRIADSIKRTQTSLELLGKTASEKLEFKINAQGLDAAKFEPALAKLRETEATALRAGTSASGSLNKIGVSAAQTANALRGVPAQFTDIVTSLQGGQAPLTVFLQQGGQLKDMFGGAGNAARALGGYVLGLVNPFTVAAGAAVALGLAYFQGSKEADAYNKALITTGNSAGTTASQLQATAKSISGIVGTQGAAADALAKLAGSSRVAAENFEYFGTVALKVEKTVGTSVAETVKQFAELGKAPVEASKKLNEETNYLTQAIYEQIKALKDQGREAAAASLAQTAYADALNSRSAQMTQNLGFIERAWSGITGAAKGAWDAMLNVGRPDSLGDQLSSARAALEQKLNTPLAVDNPAMRASREKGIENLRQQIYLLTEQERIGKRSAETQAERARTEKAAIDATDALTKANEKALTKQQQMNKALEEYRANLEKVRAVNAGSPLLAPGQVSKTEAAIRDQFRERGGVGAKAENVYASLIASIRGKIEAEKLELASGAAISESQKIRIKLDQDMAAGRVKLTQSAEKNVRAALDELSASEASALAKKAIEKADVSAAAARQKYLTSLDSGLDKIQADTAAQIESAARLGLSKNAIAALDSAKLEMLATDLELQAIKSLDKNLDEETYNALKKQAEAYRDLAKAKQGKAAKETSIDMEKASTEAAKKAEAEWQKTADSINNSLTDALLRGFESGKDFAANLRDTVVNMFKTLVLRPIISAVVNPVAGALTGALGLGGPASAATGGGGFASSASTLSSLFTTGSSFITTATNAIGSTYSALTGAAASNIIGSTAASGLAATAGGTAIGGAAGIGSGTALGGGAATASGGGALGAIGSAAPYIAAAALLYEAMQYKVESKGGGIVANLGGGGDVARYNEFQQTGGLFGGGTTTNRDWSKAEQGLSDFVNNSVKAITDVNKSYAGAIGLTSDSIGDFTKSVEINLSGLDAAAQQAAIAKELQAFSNEQIAAAFGATLSEFANAGETTSQTLQRLGDDLAGANSALGSLGYALYDVSVAGASAASSLVSAFGNLQNFQAQMAGVMQNYYTQDEQRASAVGGAYGALTGAGITQFSEADIAGASREQIRTVIDQYASARGTAEGDKQYAAIVSVANAITKFVPDFEKANAAPQQQQQSSSGGGGGGRSESTVDPWKSAADAIVGAIKDLQNSLLETGPDSFARLQAQYAIDVARAKAGDVEAATGLPDLAKSVANAAKDYGQTSLEQAMLIGSLIDSMADVVKSRGITVPGFASGGMHSGGWAVVGEQGPELVNMGPSRIYTAADTQNMLGGNSAELVAEIRALREEVATLRYSSEATATATRQTAKTLDNAANGGQPIGTVATT